MSIINLKKPTLVGARAQVIAVKDSAADIFLAPLVVNHVGIGIRSFTDAINDGQSDFSKHPSDYDLYLLGTMDAQTGLFYPTETGQPERLSRGVDVAITKQ